MKKVMTDKADYAYQTPTVVGTQIQIAKQSDTARLYFKLSLAELAQTQEMDKTELQLALAELADIIVGGGENG